MSEAKYWEERETAKAKALKLAAKSEAAQNEDYAKALKREKDREYQRRKAKKREIQVSQLYPDDPRMRTDDTENSPAWESDNGTGADLVLRADGDNTIAYALSCLTPKQRTFAENVLNGKKWEEIGISESTFYRLMKKVENIFRNIDSHPPKTLA